MIDWATSWKNKVKEIKQKIKSKKPVGRRKYQTLVDVYKQAALQSTELINSVEDAREEHEELTRLKEELARRNETGGDTPQPNEERLHDLEIENYLLREANEALIKEKAELEKIIASLETDKQQQKEEFEKKLAQSQRSIENIEDHLVECCSKCLAEEEEESEENIIEAKEAVLRLYKKLGVDLSPQLEKDIEEDRTYKDLLTNLIKTHDAKMIKINQEDSEEEPTEISQTEAPDSSPASQVKTSSGVKYFLWITGILAVISFILFLVKKGKLGTFKPGKKQK